MSSSEFAHWMAYDRMSPGGEERSDLRTALTTMVIANTQKGKKGRQFTIDDFLLKFKRKSPERKPANEIKTKLLSWLHMSNVKTVTKKK